MAKYTFHIDGTDIGTYSTVEMLTKHTSLDAANDRNIIASGDNIDFKELFDFKYSDHYKIIIKNVKLENLVFNSIPRKVTFENVEIEELEFNSSTSCSHLHFIKCQINHIKIIDFQHIRLLEFNNCDITKLMLHKVGSIDDFCITDCNIDKLKIQSNKIIAGVTKLQGTSVSNINLSIQNSIIDANLEDCLFPKPIEISNSTLKEFRCKQCFFYCSKLTLINNSSITVYIEQSVFKSFKQIISVGNKGNLIFNNCFFEDELQVIEDNVINIFEFKLIVKDSVFRELVFFDENSVQGLIFEKSLFVKSIFLPTNRFETERLSKNVSSSIWCIKKNQAIEKNDKITALYYRKLEMISYSNEIRKKRGSGEDRVLLFFNYISNLHGLSWKRGVFFTLTSWFIAFTIYYWSLCGNQINFDWHYLIYRDKEFWSDAFNFLWLPSSDLKDISRAELDTIGGICLFFVLTSFLIGKVIIGYGVYQTVAAFRKHGKL